MTGAQTFKFMKHLGKALDRAGNNVELVDSLKQLGDLAEELVTISYEEGFKTGACIRDQGGLYELQQWCLKMASHWAMAAPTVSATYKVVSEKIDSIMNFGGGE